MRHHTSSDLTPLAPCARVCLRPATHPPGGQAIGEGFTTLMMGDIIYSSDKAYFWAPFARFGVVPEITSAVSLPQRVGK